MRNCYRYCVVINTCFLGFELVAFCYYVVGLSLYCECRCPGYCSKKIILSLQVLRSKHDDNVFNG